MIERNIAMAVLGALPDDKLLKALQVAGVAPMAGMDGLSMAGGAMGAPMGDEGNKITPWSQKEMTYGGGKDRPPLIDRMWAKPEMNATEPVPAGVLDSDNGQYLQTGGM